MIKIVEKDKEKKKLSFTTDIPETLANAIRRSALEIPILAIDEVEFFKNDSALYDELIAHRLGLVPLITEKTFTEREKCSCKGKGCAKCSVDLKIKAKGPCTVYSKSLKGKVKPVFERIPIVILNEGQELELSARAKLGKGIEHIKFSPGLIFYRNVAKIEIKDCDDCMKCVEACPQKILRIEKGKADITDIYKCDLCEACVEACKKHGKNAIKISKDDYLIFFIESWGQIAAKDIFIGAIEKLDGNLKELSKKIK
jgi:DNA-directed RNA polymerase subunit D